MPGMTNGGLLVIFIRVIFPFVLLWDSLEWIYWSLFLSHPLAPSCFVCAGMTVRHTLVAKMMEHIEMDDSSYAVDNNVVSYY